MGNEEAKPNNKGSIPIYNKNIDKSKLDILVKKIYFTVELDRDRKKGLYNKREKDLLNLIKLPEQKRNKEDEYQAASALVNDAKSIKAHECVMRYANVIKDNETVIQDSKGNPQKVSELIQFIEGILWGCQKLNIDCVKPFAEFIIDAFGNDVYAELTKSTKVPEDLKQCYDSILPSKKEVKKYFTDLCKKYGIKYEALTNIGHDLTEEEEEVVEEKTTTIIQINYGNNGNNGGNQGGFNQGGFQGGFNQGGFNQGGFNQGGFNQGGFNQGGFNQGGYNQGGFNQGGFNQGGFNQGGINQQTGFNQGGQDQGGFNQGGFNQGGYYQGGFNQGGIQGGNQIGYNQNNQGGQFGYNPNSNQNIQVQIDTQNQYAKQDLKFNDVQQTTSIYPTFDKFNVNTNLKPNNITSNNDPLDELEARLRDIKDNI